MQSAEIPIPVPCEARLEDMQHREPGRRYCEHCKKHVHSLSAMTEREAKAFLQRADDDICVSYAADLSGKLLFAPEPSRRVVRLPVVVGVAAALAACSPSKSKELDDRARVAASASAAAWEEAEVKAAEECARKQAREIELEQKVLAAANASDQAKLQAELAKARESHLDGKEHRRTAGSFRRTRTEGKSGCNCAPNDPLCSCF